MPTGAPATALQVWKKEIEEESKGKLKIKFFWGQSLMKAKATLKGVGSGLAEMGTVIAAYTPADMPVSTTATSRSTSLIPGSVSALCRMSAKTGSSSGRKKKKNKIRMLFQNVTGPVHLLCGKEQIDTLEKLKGKKIRSIGGYIQLFKSMGAVPVKIGFGELYSALDRGTVDCTVNYTVFVKSYKHYEVAKHLMMAYMGQSIGYGGAINLNFYNKLPDDLRGILDRASDRYMDNYGKNLIDDAKAAAGKWRPASTERF